MTNEELLSVAEIVEKLTDRFNAQAALHRERHNEYDKLIASMNDDHEAKMVEHRAAFGARTEADAKIIAGLRADLERVRNSLGIQAAKEANKVLGMIEGEGLRGAAERVVQERDALRAEVDFLKTLRPKYKVGDKLESYSSAVTIVGVRTVYDCQIDGAEYPVGHSEDELKECYEQTPKQHPVKVGEWARRTTPHIDGTPAGSVQQVRAILPAGTESSTVVYEMQSGSIWAVDYCEPCDPPAATAKLAPKVGDTVRLVTHPERAQVAEHLRAALQWPWIPRWGLVGQTGKVLKPLVAVAEAVAVALDGSTVIAWWPIDCLEVVAEATHDTEEGKAVAESAVRTEPVAEEIKVGDVVEVVSNTGLNTWLADVGSFGTVTSIETLEDSLSVRLKDVPDKKNVCGGYVSICDVRKVTT